MNNHDHNNSPPCCRCSDEQLYAERPQQQSPGDNSELHHCEKHQSPSEFVGRGRVYSVQPATAEGDRELAARCRLYSEQPVQRSPGDCCELTKLAIEQAAKRELSRFDLILLRTFQAMPPSASVCSATSTVSSTCSAPTSRQVHNFAIEVVN